MGDARIIDFRIFNAVSERAAEVHRFREIRKTETGLNKWQVRQHIAAQEFMKKVIRNRDIIPGKMKLNELLGRGLFDLERDYMIRERPRYPEIIGDMELIDLSKENDRERAETDRRICLDLLRWMAEKW